MRAVEGIRKGMPHAGGPSLGISMKKRRGEWGGSKRYDEEVW